MGNFKASVADTHNPGRGSAPRGRRRWTALVAVAAIAAAMASPLPSRAATGTITTGTITTVAGGGGVSGTGPATATDLRAIGVTVLGGTVYIVDDVYNVVRVFDPTAGTVTTVAGNGETGYAGDGGLAVRAKLNLTLGGGLAKDASGNLYIADTFNDRVRKVDPGGTITTVVGVAPGGFSGDGGPANVAKLNRPDGLALDAAGNLYIVDTRNFRIRKVDPGGTITTVAGTGTNGFSGDGGPALLAQLGSAHGLARDALGNLYIADTSNSRVRKIDPGGTITTVAGLGRDGFSGDGVAVAVLLNRPYGVALDASGNLYIADTLNHRVRRVDPNGLMTTVAGSTTPGIQPGFDGDGGPSVVAKLNSPNGVAADASGNLYIADTGNNRIRRVDPGGTITTVAGTGIARRGFGGDGGPAVRAYLRHPQGVAKDASGNLYIGDPGNNRVRKVDAGGTITTVAGTGTAGFAGDGGPATSAQLTTPTAVVKDASGNLYIADEGNRRVRKVDPGGTITTVAGTGTEGFAGDGGPATAAQLATPGGLALDASGNLYIADAGNNRVRRVDPGGTITTVAGPGTEGFTGDNQPATSAGIRPQSLALDAKGNLYMADFTNHRIGKVAAGADGVVNGGAEEIFTTVAGTGTLGFNGDNQPATSAQLNYPYGVALDAANIYIADGDNNRVRRVDPNGVITTVAGTGVGDFNGDGLAATDTTLHTPRAVTVDTAGNLYIADSDNFRVRKVQMGPGLSLRARVADFNGDAATDHSVFRDGAWYAEGQPTVFLGAAGDIAVPADYNGDGRTERAVYRAGAWYVEGQPTVFLGVAGDIPVPGDYNGDGTADKAVFRPESGAWHVEGQPTEYFGISTDIPVPGDYDGNATADRAVFRPEVGGWYVQGQTTVFHGLNADIPVPGDYDANATTDRAVFRPGVGGWYVEGQATVFVGLNGDIPVPGDYNADGRTDRAIWRPDVGGWYVEGQPTVFLGLRGDVPLPLPQAIYRSFF